METRVPWARKLHDQRPQKCYAVLRIGLPSCDNIVNGHVEDAIVRFPQRKYPPVSDEQHRRSVGDLGGGVGYYK
jgi:hypothetical protein